MPSSKRISKVFESAHKIAIDDTSKIVIMSDCHRGDGSWSDSFADNRNLFLAALTKYNKEKYTYIELGDGDELWENKRYSDIISLYKSIFSLMSRFFFDNRLYLLYGNHDKVKENTNFVRKNLEFLPDDGTPLFPKIKIYEGLILKYTASGNSIFLLHGHQVDFLNSTLWRLSRFLVRNLWKRLEIIGVNDPTSASKNDSRKNKVEKSLMQWSQNEKQMLIAGHTHRAVFPEPGNTLYFNDGSCVHRDYITAIEIENGDISFVKWSQKIRDDGYIYVGRDIVAGPGKLKDYFNNTKVQPVLMKNTYKSQRSYEL